MSSAGDMASRRLSKRLWMSERRREHGLDDTVDLYGAKGALRAARLADSPHLTLA